MVRVKSRLARTVVELAAALALAGLAGLASSALAAGAKPNTFTVSGTYHGTLTVMNPASDCFIEEFNNPHLSDAVKLGPLTGALSALKGTAWSFLATEPRQGTFVTAHTNQSIAARLRPLNPNAQIAFSQTSGTITFAGKTGSAHMRMVFNNGGQDTVTESVVGSWSCPVVHHL
jgi:hypothetical protein